MARDPLDDALVVGLRGESQVVWLPGDGGVEPLATLDGSEYQFDHENVQGPQIIEDGGRTRALVAGSETQDGEPLGSVTLWDIADRSNPNRVWRYPADGGVIGLVASCLRRYDGLWVLVYTHMDEEGKQEVGVAWLADLDLPPVHVVDLTMSPARYSWFTGVDLTADGTIVVLEPGASTQDDHGLVWVGSLPELVASGVSGASDAERVTSRWHPSVLISDASRPFDAEVWPRPSWIGN